VRQVVAKQPAARDGRFLAPITNPGKAKDHREYAGITLALDQFVRLSLGLEVNAYL